MESGGNIGELDGHVLCHFAGISCLQSMYLCFLYIYIYLYTEFAE